jgi:hypothetical protein
MIKADSFQTTLTCVQDANKQYTNSMELLLEEAQMNGVDAIILASYISNHLLEVSKIQTRIYDLLVDEVSDILLQHALGRKVDGE